MRNLWHIMNLGRPIPAAASPRGQFNYPRRFPALPSKWELIRSVSSPQQSKSWRTPCAKVIATSAAALALSACAPRPVVTIYCATPEQVQKLKDAEPPRVGDKLTGQAQDDLKTIAGSAVRLRAWGEGLIGVLEGCQEPPR